MPTDRPSHAADPDDLPANDARDDRTAARVLSDGERDDAPGGGGLGGASAALGAPRAIGGAAPNSPLGEAMAAGDSDADAGREARTRSAREAPGEQHPSSL